MATSFKLEDIFSVKGKVWPTSFITAIHRPLAIVSLQIHLYTYQIPSKYIPRSLHLSLHGYIQCLAHPLDYRDNRRRIWIRKRCATFHPRHQLPPISTYCITQNNAIQDKTRQDHTKTTSYTYDTYSTLEGLIQYSNSSWIRYQWIYSLHHRSKGRGLESYFGGNQ